jgi:molecular chaperone DnaJ
MPKRDFHSILGVPAGASAQAIKAAYRRLAIELHPDTGREPDPARFSEVHDAYVALSDAARRRSGYIQIDRVSRSSTPTEEIRAGGPLRILDDFESMAPSLGEILDHIAQNFFGFHQESGGPHRRLALEIVLSPREAAAGGRLPFEVPCYEPCPHCRGDFWMWGLCPLCHGYGMVEGGRQVTLDIPPGIRSGSTYEIGLDSAGISNLTLVVTVLVA